jgi:hypothetical protein
MNSSKRPFARRLLATLASFSLATGFSLSAAADSVEASGGPTQVEYPGYLMIQYAGVNYRTSTSSPCAGVAAVSTDAVKIWASLAQASLLSGKNMKIYFKSCVSNGVTTRYITDLVLKK